ncbi:hypothetical protein PQG02_23490 [Nostoc sp. UHCC 0926]|uniref:hypothetical protein n=1 Tax=Nostoc sp. TaxID=1180 RepID=UPI0027A7C717|nr:hypothetical protein PQG02_23490 [Nostoc sp. UHCC 0926]
MPNDISRLKSGNHARQFLLGETPYSPSLTGRLAANGHPTAGASLSRMEEDLTADA